MQGICLKFYFQELRQHGGILLYEWLLEAAKQMKIHGGSVFRGVAGFGHHGVLHEEHFFELGSNVPVEVAFFVTDEEAHSLLEGIKKEKLEIFFVRYPIEFGMTPTA